LPPKEGPLSEGYFAIPMAFADARSLLWRLEAERHRPRILARRHARQLHPTQKRDSEFEHAASDVCISLNLT
jgi:hypothetical protein